MLVVPQPPKLWIRHCMGRREQENFQITVCLDANIVNMKMSSQHLG